MNPDIAIQEIREVRHQMTADCGHDLDRFFTMLQEEEKKFEPQIRRFREIERQYQQASIPQSDQPEDTMDLRDKPKILNPTCATASSPTSKPKPKAITTDHIIEQILRDVPVSAEAVGV